MKILAESDEGDVIVKRSDLAAALLIDRARLADALYAYVGEHGYLDLGAMEHAFRPQAFREVADLLGALYDAELRHYPEPGEDR